VRLEEARHRWIKTSLCVRLPHEIDLRLLARCRQSIGAPVLVGP
jgi:hypothetical protein